MPPSSLITTFLTMSVPGASSFVIVQVLVSPLPTTIASHASYDVAYPATAGSTTEYVPASRLRVFFPLSVSAPSCVKPIGLPPFTLNEKSVAILAPPELLITIFFTISVPGLSLFVIVHVFV